MKRVVMAVVLASAVFGMVSTLVDRPILPPANAVTADRPILPLNSTVAIDRPILPMRVG